MTATGQESEGGELRAQRAYADGDLEGALGLWEQQHTLLLGTGDTLGAARAAVMVANHLLIDTGLMAPVRGWLGRAERLLEASGETPLHAMLAAIHGYERLFSGDVDGAVTWAARALDLGVRYDQTDATVIGQTCTARIALLTGDLDSGLVQLNEVGARLMAGDATDLVTGMMLCEVVCAAQGLAMHDLAREWTDVMETWRHRSGFGGLHGRCRVHRAELLRVSGPMAAAEAEALGACEDLRPWMRREYGWPLVELGTIRVHRGDLEGAQEAFDEATAHAWCPQPGLALLHLARGEVQAAARMIADAIAHPVDLPWKERPPFGDLRLAPMLHAQGEIALAARDRQVCTAAAERATAIAARFPSRALTAMATVTRARAALLGNDLAQARALAQSAVALWADLDAPYESAAARTVLAQVHASSGEDELARSEWLTARRVFAGYGAMGRVAQIDAILPRSVTHRAVVDPVHEAEFLVQDGLRTVRFGSAEAVLADLKGFRYLEHLLTKPGREMHVLDLVSAERGDAVERNGVPAQAGIPVLDAEAREAYRRQLADVDDDIETARRENDLARQELAERDREYLIAALNSAVGLAGRVRTSGSTAERARTSVARSLRYALQRLAVASPDVALHLDRAVKTGTYCSYQPDPLSPVRWTTGNERTPGR